MTTRLAILLLAAVPARAAAQDAAPADTTTAACEDETKGLTARADDLVALVGDRDDLVVVGHSLGGFVAPAASRMRRWTSRGRWGPTRTCRPAS